MSGGFCAVLIPTPPKFLRTPNDQTGVQGGVASFNSKATGDPRPKIVWNKKGKKVRQTREFERPADGRPLMPIDT
ncbi:unnamed protein product [Boreogadus saida]